MQATCSLRRGALAGLLLLSGGCSYVHFGRVPASPGAVMAQNNDLKAENAKLQEELALTQKQGTTLRALLENSPEAGAASRQLVADLNETTRQLASLRNDYAQLKAERDRLQTGPSAAPSAPTQLADVNSKMGDTENKLAMALRSFTILQGENDALRAKVDKVQAENSALSTQVRTLTSQNQEAQSALSQLSSELLSQKEARSRSAQEAETLRTQLGAANERVATLTAARTSSAGNAQAMAPGLRVPDNPSASVPMAQLETSAERIRNRAAATAGNAPAETETLITQLSELRAKVGSLEAERASLQRQVASGSTGLPANADPGSTEAKLAMALRSFAVVQGENDKLKSDAERIAAERAAIASQLAASRGSATAPDQVNALREQLRTAQTQAAALADENARLKSNLGSRAGVAVIPSAPAPATASISPSAPTRPSAVPIIIPGTQASDAAAPSAPARTHVIASGDTLAKISRQYYGTADRWTDILDANREILRDEKSLVIGRSLRIP